MNQISASPYQIPKEPGTGLALLLAGLMHGLLFLFLWVGIHWQSKTPVGVEAEIWDMSTREAAPKSSPPPPPPELTQPTPPPPPPEKVEPSRAAVEQAEAERDVEIALERAREQKLAEKKRIAQQLEEQKAAEKVQQQKEQLAQEKRRQEELKEQKQQKELQQTKAAEQKRLDQIKADQSKAAALEQKQRADNLKLLSPQVLGSGGSGDAVKSRGNNRVDAGYAGKIAAKIKSNMVYPGSDNGSDNPTVEFSIDLFPDGSLRGVPHKTRSSGVPSFDEAVERAISRSAPFPADKSGNVPSTIPLTYRLKD